MKDESGISVGNAIGWSLEAPPSCFDFNGTSGGLMFASFAVDQRIPKFGRVGRVASL